MNKMKNDLNIACPQCLRAARFFGGEKRATVQPDRACQPVTYFCWMLWY